MCTETNTYNRGDRVRCTGTLKNLAGDEVDPTTAFAWYLNPARELTTLTYGDGDLLKSATGIYYFDLNVDTQGNWYYGFYSTDTGKAASPDTKLIVKNSLRFTS